MKMQKFELPGKRSAIEKKFAIRKTLCIVDCIISDNIVLCYESCIVDCIFSDNIVLCYES